MVTIPLIDKEVKEIRRKCQRNPKKVLNDTCFLVFQMAALKGTEWAYENEYRLLYIGDLCEQGMNSGFIVDFFKNNIQGILIGYKNKEEKAIKESVNEYRPDVWVRKMDCSSSEFEMGCEKLPIGTKELEKLEEKAEVIKTIEIVGRILRGKTPNFVCDESRLYLHRL